MRPRPPIATPENDVYTPVAMMQPAPYAHLLLGRQLCGKWRLLRVIGTGGMSTVFEAMHRNGRRVAIKVLHPELALRRRLCGRFKREAYVANRIEHKDVVQILDEDTTDDGLVFIVMEYLEGETLGSRMKRAAAPLEPAEVVSAAIRVLDILMVAHRSGVIHRDIKPENIFRLHNEARIKLLDFGIASLHEISAGFADLTENGVPLGTPAFMAPEQARGHCDRVDARTDLWGLGATMFTLLTGRYVHGNGNACEILISAGTKAAPSLEGVASQVVPELVSVVDRALAFEKDARWSDAVSMQNALIALPISVRGRTLVGSPGRGPPVFELDTLAESDDEPQASEGAEGEGQAIPLRESRDPGSPGPAGPGGTPLRARQLSAVAAITFAAALLWSHGLGLGTAPSASRVPATTRQESAAEKPTDSIPPVPPAATLQAVACEASVNKATPRPAASRAAPRTSVEIRHAMAPATSSRQGSAPPGTSSQRAIDPPIPAPPDPLDRR